MIKHYAESACQVKKIIEGRINGEVFSDRGLW